MENFFEKELKTRCEDTPYSDLYIQWQATKINIPEFLSMIRDAFPHFTLHDVSHSENILSNIKKILTEETIKKLSTTDIWMLLFVAYFHDIGMYVFKEDYSKIIESSLFSNYIKDIQSKVNDPLNKYAGCFEVTDNNLKYKSTTVSIESINALKYLIAGFLRDKHSERSENFIKNKSFIYLPPSIPSRIINLLAEICQLHTEKDFNIILKLSKEEDGFLDDYCHPLFIACMLRLGDVLDIDNNRFSNVILSALPSIPADSLIHFEKHRSIKEKHINNTEISLAASSNNINTGELTNSWFNLISKEIENQTKNWQNIIPISNFSSLPAIKKLEVHIADYDLIKGSEPPKFSVNSTKALTIIQGNDFYDTKFTCFREVLQNATDATYLRIFIEKGNSIKNDISKFKEECKKHAIQVFIDNDSANTDLLKIRIKDEGIGINNYDLECILHNGQSNKIKADIIKKMPEWMKPSGIFGIGLHSIFSITDKFIIKSDKLNSGEHIEAEFYSPASSHKGNVYTKTTRNNIPSIKGTEVVFDYLSNKIPPQILISTKYPNTSSQFENYDFLNSANENFELTQIIDIIVNFTNYSYIPISLNLNGVNIFSSDIQENPFQFSDEEKNFELNFYSPSHFSRVFYRGQLVEKVHPHFRFFSLDINILSGDASRILQISRNDFQEEYTNVFWDKLKKALNEIINNNISIFDSSLAPYAAMYLELHDALNEENKSFWKNYRLKFLNGNEDQLYHILEGERITFIHNTNFASHSPQNPSELDSIIIEYNHPAALFLREKFDKLGYYLSWDYSDGYNYLNYSQQKPDVLIRNRSEFIHQLKHQRNARCLIPCENKYTKLKIKPNSASLIPMSYTVPDFYDKRNSSTELMIFPIKLIHKDYFNREFETSTSLSDELLNKIKPFLADESISITEIRDLYNQFIEEFLNQRE